MINELLRRFAYTKLIDFAQRATGFRPHYKAAYAQYLQGPRWLILRELRKWWDGWECVRCGDRRGLQVHHLSYDHKGRGLGVREFLDLRTLCDECHAWAHGKDRGDDDHSNPRINPHRTQGVLVQRVRVYPRGNWGHHFYDQRPAIDCQGETQRVEDSARAAIYSSVQ